MTEIVAAGYVAIRPVPRPDWPGFSALPDPLTSLYDFLCPHGPVLTWCGGARDELTKFGVPDERMDDACAWIDERDRAGEIFHTNVSTNRSVPTEFVRLFAPDAGARIVGYGLRAAEVDAFLAEHAATLGQRDGIIEVLERRTPLAAGGRLLGYESCGVDFGGIRASWIVHDLVNEVERATGARVNEEGFVDATDVDRVGEYIEQTDGKEPGIWRMLAVVEYPTT